MAFAATHPGVSSALLGVRMTEQLGDLLAGLEVMLSEDILDRVDEIVPPGTDVRHARPARSTRRTPPALQDASLRRRPVSAAQP